MKPETLEELLGPILRGTGMEIRVKLMGGLYVARLTDQAGDIIASGMSIRMERSVREVVDTYRYYQERGGNRG